MSKNLDNKNDLTNTNEEQVLKTEPHNEQQKPTEKKTSTWKYILNISLVLIISGVAVFLSLRNNYKLIINYLLTSDFNSFNKTSIDTSRFFSSYS